MKFLVLSVVVAVAVLGLTAEAGTSRLIRRQAPTAVSYEQPEWEQFKTLNNKSYPDPEEDARRFELYKKTVAEINEHNEKYKKGEVGWSMGVNQFSDLTQEEKDNHRGYVKRPY